MQSSVSILRGPQQRRSPLAEDSTCPGRRHGVVGRCRVLKRSSAIHVSGVPAPNEACRACTRIAACSSPQLGRALTSGLTERSFDASHRPLGTCYVPENLEEGSRAASASSGAMGVISSARHIWSPTHSADGETLLFTKPRNAGLETAIYS